MTAQTSTNVDSNASGADPIRTAVNAVTSNAVMRLFLMDEIKAFGKAMEAAEKAGEEYEDEGPGVYNGAMSEPRRKLADYAGIFSEDENFNPTQFVLLVEKTLQQQPQSAISR